MNSKVYMKRPSTPFSCSRKISQDRFGVWFKQTYVLCFALAIVLGVYYVWALNANANNGYAMSEINQRYDELQDQLNILNTRIGDESSIRKTEGVDDGMIEISDQNETTVYIEDAQLVFNQILN